MADQASGPDPYQIGSSGTGHPDEASLNRLEGVPFLR